MTTSSRRTAATFMAYAFILSLVPLAFFFSNWHWQPSTDEALPLAPLLLITESGSLPYAIATSIIFSALLIWLNRRRLPLFSFILLIILSVACTQIQQKQLKSLFALPRPYIAAITATDNDQQSAAFYALDKTLQESIVRHWHQTQHKNAWLTEHRVKEIAYRFPSGHSIFSVSWVLLFAVFCRHKWLTASLALWSALVMASRVWLGMHLPIDLLGGIFTAFWTNALLIALFCQYWRQRHNKMSAKRQSFI